MKNYYFRIIIKTKSNTLNIFAFKNDPKFTYHNLEKLCSRSLALASLIPVFGLERVCPRKVGSWPRISFESLALALKVVSSTPPLASTLCMLFTIYLVIIMLDIGALERRWFGCTIAKFNKKHRCYTKTVMKSNHKGRQTKAEMNIRSRSLMSQAKKMSHHIQSRILLYTENRGIQPAKLKKMILLHA